MERSVVKGIVYIIVLFIISEITKRLKGRKKIDADIEKNGEFYVISSPSAVKYVYLAMFLLGIILFLIFLFFKIKWNANISIGNFRFAVIFAAIGLLIMLWTLSWKINVNGTELKVYKLFHLSKIVLISDIKRVEIGKKQEFILYDKDDQKLITIDALSENYDKFQKTLKDHGKIQ